MDNFKAAVKTVKEHFEPFVGQTEAKARISDIILGGLVEEGFIAPVLITAPPGIGKTKFMLAVRSLLRQLYPDRKTIYFQSGKEMGSPAAFFEDCLVPYVHEKDAALLIDELHEAGPNCLSVLRQLVEITANRAPKEVKRGDYSCVFNPKRHAIIVATNRIDLLDPALLSRFERVELSFYSDEEMEQILFSELKNDGIHFNENTLRDIAECNRGTARDIIHWINAIRRHLGLAQKKTINKEDVRTIIRNKECYPCGVTKAELNTLLYLEKENGQQLQSLANKNQCSFAEQKVFEKYLMNRSFIRVDGTRFITAQGREYLERLRKDKFIPPIKSV